MTEWVGPGQARLRAGGLAAAALVAAGFLAVVAFFAAGFFAGAALVGVAAPGFSIDFFSAAIRSTTLDADRPPPSSLSSMILRLPFCLRLRSIRSLSAST